MGGGGGTSTTTTEMLPEQREFMGGAWNTLGNIMRGMYGMQGTDEMDPYANAVAGMLGKQGMILPATTPGLGTNPNGSPNTTPSVAKGPLLDFLNKSRPA